MTNQAEDGLSIEYFGNFEGNSGIGLDFKFTTNNGSKSKEIKLVGQVIGFETYDIGEQWEDDFLVFCAEYKRSRGLQRIHSYKALAHKFIAQSGVQGLTVEWNNF
jgi:hypothetical protein